MYGVNSGRGGEGEGVPQFGILDPGSQDAAFFQLCGEEGGGEVCCAPVWEL